jgi:uracil-DNA glycosylase
MAGNSRLVQHCHALVDCRLCGHASTIVPIVSNASAPKVMLVGQAPGQVEAEGGQPFAGRAGKTLFRWLERAGVDEETARRHIYIAAITRCYPGPSPSGRGDRVPSPAEQEACAVWLDAELEIIKPKLLIPVGRLAIARFLPNLPLDELIGREHGVSHRGGESRAVPLPHPSGASSWVHQGNHPQLLDRALELIAAELQGLGIGSGFVKRSMA